jgi:hypothetical protein
LAGGAKCAAALVRTTRSKFTFLDVNLGRIKRRRRKKEVTVVGEV